MTARLGGSATLNGSAFSYKTFALTESSVFDSTIFLSLKFLMSFILIFIFYVNFYVVFALNTENLVIIPNYLTSIFAISKVPNQKLPIVQHGPEEFGFILGFGPMMRALLQEQDKGLKCKCILCHDRPLRDMFSQVALREGWQPSRPGSAVGPTHCP